MGLITAFFSTLQTIAVVALPGVDPVVLTLVTGSITGFLGVLIAFIANTSTTPTADPQLKAGTSVRVMDEDGVVIGHERVPTPAASRPGRDTTE
jgi:hypothetical protein